MERLENDKWEPTSEVQAKKKKICQKTQELGPLVLQAPPLTLVNIEMNVADAHNSGPLYTKADIKINLSLVHRQLGNSIYMSSVFSKFAIWNAVSF